MTAVSDHLAERSPDPSGAGPVADRSGPGGGGPATRRRHRLALGVAATAYLALAVAVWWQVWTSHPTSTTTCGCGDSSLFTWFLAWPAYALVHGADPLYSTAMLHPTGVNLLANTAEIGVGVVLAPVTWLFGPVATLNVALTLSPALSALAMYVLVRTWVAWAPAAFVAGLLYGFSPFVLVSLSDGHLMLGLAVLPPLMVLALDELLVRQQHPPALVGVALGLLVVLQFLIGTEVLAIMAITGAVAVAVMAATWARRPAAHRGRAGHAARGVAAAGATSAVLLAYPVWFVLAGPAHYSGSIWTAPFLGGGGVRLKQYVVPAPSAEALVSYLHRIGGYQGPSLSNQYLGIGLVAVVVLGLVVWRRDRRLWFLGAVGLVSAVLSLGTENPDWVPWRVLSHVPLVQNIIPVRFVIVTYLVAAAMVGIVVDHTHRAVSQRGGGNATARGHPPAPARRRGVPAPALAVAVAAVALVPVGAYLAQTVPMTTQTVVLPTWFQTVAPRLPGGQVLLAFPVPFTVDTDYPVQSAMTWQAVDRMHYAMVGAGGPAARVTRPGAQRRGQELVAELSGPFDVAGFSTDQVRALRRALVAWGVTTVVLPDQPRLPPYDRVASVASTAAVLTATIGAPPELQASAWVWDRVGRAPAWTAGPAGRLAGCAAGVASARVTAVESTTACVLAQAPNPGSPRP